MNFQLEDYIEEHIDGVPEPLEELNRFTNVRLLNGRMCSGHLQGRLLKMLTRMAGPKTILEMGTFSGYSALCMAEALPADGQLHTIEVNDELEPVLREWFARSRYGRLITLHIGDAVEITKELGKKLGAERGTPTPFDMVFIDADKRFYPEYYEAVKPLVRPGGYILADNTLWDGHVVETDRKDGQTLGIRRFNDIVASDGDVEKVIIPLRDGLTIIRKKENDLKGSDVIIP